MMKTFCATFHVSISVQILNFRSDLRLSRHRYSLLLAVLLCNHSRCPKRCCRDFEHVSDRVQSRDESTKDDHRLQFLVMLMEAVTKVIQSSQVSIVMAVCCGAIIPSFRN